MSSEQATGEQTDAATEARPLFDPNDFQLKGDGVTISYSTTSFTGAPQFRYKDATHDLNVSGDEIATTSSPAGELVTITLEIHPDVKDVRLTLVIPTIKLYAGEKASFTTFAIETTDRSQSFVAPPGPSGVLQTYRLHKLHGEAQKLDF